MVKNPPAHAGNAEDIGSILGSERSPGEDGNPLQYAFLPGKPMVRRAEKAKVHSIPKELGIDLVTKQQLCCLFNSVNNKILKLTFSVNNKILSLLIIK